MFRLAGTSPRSAAPLLLAVLPVCVIYFGAASAADAVTYSNPATIVINDATDAFPTDIPAKERRIHRTSRFPASPAR
jgi:hypothetical protein